MTADIKQHQGGNITAAFYFVYAPTGAGSILFMGGGIYIYRVRAKSLKWGDFLTNTPLEEIEL